MKWRRGRVPPPPPGEQCQLLAPSCGELALLLRRSWPRALGRLTSPKLEQHQRLSLPLCVTVYSLDGILVFGLLFVCTCAYFKKVPRLKTWLLSEKKGVWGVFYKGKVFFSRPREEIDLSRQRGSLNYKAGGWGCIWIHLYV